MAPSSTPLKTVVIKNSQWLRGKGVGRLRVRHIPSWWLGVSPKDIGKMCCIGIDGVCLGLDPEALLDHAFPSTIPSPKHDDALLASYKAAWPDSLAERVAKINDSRDLASDDERIAKLRPLFREVGRIIRWLPNA